MADWFSQNAPQANAPQAKSTGGDWFAQNAPGAATSKQPGTLERVGRAFKEWTPPAPASDWPELGPQFRQQLVDLYHQIAGIVPATNRALNNTGNAMLRGDVMGTLREAPGIVPVVGPMTQQIGEDVSTGKYPEAAGHLLNLGTQVFGPRAIESAPRVVEAVTDAAKTAAPVAAGAAKGAVKAIPRAIETSVLKYTGVPQIVRGAVNGAKTALAERIQAAVAKTQEAVAKTQEATPQPPAGPEAPPVRGFLPSPATQMPAATDGSFVRSVPAQYPAKPMPGMPAPQQLLGPGPVILDPPPDASFVRAVPGEYPANLPPEVMQELTRPSEATPPPVESSIATAPAPAETAPQSQNVIEFPSNWSPKARELGIQLQQELSPNGTPPPPVESAPSRDFAAEARADRAANSKTLSDALIQGKISFEDAQSMDASHWKMLADGIGAKIPNAKGISEVLANLKALEEPVSPASPSESSPAVSKSGVTPPQANPLQAAAERQKAVVAKSKAKLNGNALPAEPHPTAAEVLDWLKRNADVVDSHDSVALRIQEPLEARRTKAGTALRPSREWIDGARTGNQLPGTAGFRLPYKAVEAMTEADIQPILDGMKRSGYVAKHPGERLVIIGGDAANGADMPEPNAAAIRGAKLIDVFARQAPKPP